MSNSNDVLYKIKPLIWSEEDVKEEFDRVTAPTSFGPYWVGLSGDMQWEWGYYFCEWSDEDEIECEGLEDGKRRAERHWQKRLSGELVEVVGD